MQVYSCGFLFAHDRTRVLLIRKNRPAWQAGKLNGLGGKLEPGETPLDAMRREFWEEAGMRIEGWAERVVLTGVPSEADPRGWRGHFFRAFANDDALAACRAKTDEALELHPTDPLPREVIPNLRWLIPLLLDDDPAREVYRVQVLGSRMG
jgi:8-oxo-dGTP diphosphatase